MLNEDRNCQCNMQNDVMPVQQRDIDCDRKEELLTEIRNYEFAIADLALYLNTHPEDQRALCLHRKYCNELKPMKDMYQRVYGPLTINYPCNKWRWLEEPWPWEGGER